MVCVCCMHVYIFMCTCISTSRVFLYHSSPYSFWGRSLTEPKHQFSNTSWSVSTRDPCLCVLPCWGYRHCLPHLTFYIVARDPNLGPHAYMASILLIEASPSLCLFFLQKSKIYKDDHSIVLAENQQLHFFPPKNFPFLASGSQTEYTEDLLSAIAYVTWKLWWHFQDDQGMWWENHYCRVVVYSKKSVTFF